MPLHSYRCKACDHSFERLVRSSDVPGCPSCGGGELDRLVSRIAPDAKSAAVLGGARAQAAREGHLSNYSRSELKRR